MKYLYNPPQIIKQVFHKYIWGSRIDEILLTFDDGPTPQTTEKILNKLKELNLKAIFFVVGDNVRKYPELAKLILENGHILGNHTFNHKILTEIDKHSRIIQIQKAQEEVLQNMNYKMEYFRPPHGRFYSKLAKDLSAINLQNVMWSLLTYDYKNDFNIIKKAIDNNLKSNSIVVFHDSIKSKDVILQSLDYIYENATEKKYVFGEPTKCLK